MPRMQAIFEQQDEQVKGIMMDILATDRAPQAPFYPPPEQVWESIAVLSEQIPWGHIAIEPAALTEGAISVDQRRLFGNIAEVPQVTPELLLSIPSILASILTATGDTLPEFWDANQGDLYKALQSETTWTKWLAIFLASERNRRLTGKFDAVTP